MPTSSSQTAAGDGGEDRGRWLHAALERYERPLVLYARRFVGDVERARDVVQETFLRLCKQERSDVEAHLSEWLFTVCRNQALDVLRKESRMTTLGEEQAERRPDRAASATELVDQHDSVQHVLDVLCSLPEKQREVLRLKFQHGLSYKEIGRVTSTNVGTVGWLVHEGIKALRAKLGNEAPKGAEA